MRPDSFLFCEMVRVEANGQHSIIGFYPGNTIVISEAPVHFPVLSCLAIFDNMQGISTMRVQCEVKLGSVTMFTTPPQEVSRDNIRLRYHTLTFAFSPFQAPRLGDYEFKITLEVAGKATSFTRRLHIQQAPAETVRH